MGLSQRYQAGKIVTVFWDVAIWGGPHPSVWLVATKLLGFPYITVLRLMILKATAELGRRGCEDSELKLHKSHYSYLISAISFNPQVVVSPWLIPSFKELTLTVFLVDFGGASPFADIQVQAQGERGTHTCTYVTLKWLNQCFKNWASTLPFLL